MSSGTTPRAFLLTCSVLLMLGCGMRRTEIAEEIRNPRAPAEFFAAHRPGRPTVLFMIGLSGSGKSTWSSSAEHFDWRRIDSDQLLLEEMGRMAAAGEVAAEIATVPDPHNSTHFYQLRERGHRLANDLLERTVAERHSFVWDSIGLNDFKTRVGAELRAKGYQIWWLIFHPEGIERNRFNLFLRESRGGFGSFKGYPIDQRCQALNRMLTKQLDELQALESRIEHGLPDTVDRVFRVDVPDLRQDSGVEDPCVALQPNDLRKR